MTKQEKADDIARILEEHYPVIPIPLDHTDPYTLLVAVLLSAQCTDKRVNQITPLLWEMADNPYDMITHSVEEIKAIIRPCGLSPMKSNAIWNFPVDTHIQRLAYRWCLSTGKNVAKTEKDLKRLYDPSIWNRLHLQIIFFGREYCPARGHDHTKCPICSKYGRKSLFK